MKIGVLIKQVPKPKAMRTTEQGFMDRNVESIMNPFCAHALEEALRFKERVSGELTVFTMGPSSFQQSLRAAMSRGADAAYHLSDRALAGSDTMATSKALANLVKTAGGVDILFAGLQTIDGDTAHVGPEVAEHLGFNQITYVEKVLDFDG